MKAWIALFALISVGGCTSYAGSGVPSTLGERSANYGYIPLDPLPVEQQSQGCNGVSPLASLPDLSVRFAVATFNNSNEMQFGPSKVTNKNGVYRAVLDYVNIDAVPAVFRIIRIEELKSGDTKFVPISTPILSDRLVTGYRATFISFGTDSVTQSLKDDLGEALVVFPVYVGVGLRLTADIRANEAGVDLNGLGTIGANADAKRLAGTMTVQTLGVTGRSVANALPLPSKLDQTTIEQSILSVGTSRTLLYESLGNDKADVVITPRVVGLYSPVGSDPRLINAVYSELSKRRVPWKRVCETGTI